MNVQDERAFALHARTRQFFRTVERSKAMISDALARMEHPYVAFSGGKDSTVVLHLVRSLAPDTPAQYGHEQWVLPETAALIAATPNVIQTALPDQHAEWYSVWQDGPDGVPDGIRYVDPAQYTEFDYGRQMLGFDGAFLGLREEESAMRRTHLRTHGAFAYCQLHGVLECNPIARWNPLDVWAYIVANQVPYNAAYDKLSALGIPPDRQRIGPLAQARVLHYGQLAILKRGWPDLYNRFAAEHPEARSYV